MKLTRSMTASVSVLALAAIASFATSASAHKTYYPYKLGATPVDPNRTPAHVGPYRPPFVAPSSAKSGTWKDVANLPFTASPWNLVSLTDGTVMVQDFCTNPNQWYRLTPDKKGKYEDGKWTKTATMPSGYEPLFMASQVLTDGRLIVNGGEYNNCSATWTNQGALYDPVANKWTSVPAPSGWANIGDAESIILPDGTYMVADCCDSPGQFGLASISGTTVTWKTVTAESCSGQPCNDEQGLTALPGGDVMMVDVWNHTSTSDNVDFYDPVANTWTENGTTSCYLSDTSTFELGPAAMMPNGNVIVFGDNPNCNSLYNVAANTWTNAKHFPLSGYDVADGPAVTLPDGHVLVQASPGVFNTPSHFFEYWLTNTGAEKFVQVNDPAQAGGTSSFESNLIMLPTGQVLWNNSQATNEVATYTPVGNPKSSWLPKISSVASSLSVGSTKNAISGKNFNGFSLGGVYGDDFQGATNFPIVRITNTGTGDVCFGRSYGFSTMGVFNTTKMNAKFDIPSSCETGGSTLQVIVNGIASAGVAVTLS